jgi:hypothetical protein
VVGRAGADVPGEAGFIGPEGGLDPVGAPVGCPVEVAGGEPAGLFADGDPGAEVVAGAPFFNPSFSRIFVKTLMVHSFR